MYYYESEKDCPFKVMAEMITERLPEKQLDKNDNWQPKTYCTKKDCAWWNDFHSECAVLRMGR